MDKTPHYDVIIIGGGITGVGTARDCAMRGLKTLLVERGDIADGATGRNHGLLHSGARYAVTDKESATECIRENMIIRKIAAGCVDPCGGWFITLPDDDLEYQDRFIKSCLEAGIKAEKVDPQEALKAEPSINPAIIGAVKVPDASVDPFLLSSANLLDAKLHGAEILTYTIVTSIIMEGGKVCGIRTTDVRSGEKAEYRGEVIVNAAGVWSQTIARMAGAEITMFPAKGSLLIFGHRVNRMVINRCRKPANADILVPGGSVTVIGTTSDRVPIEECDDMRVSADEVKVLLEEGCRLAPELASTRIMRAYAGVRPLVASDNDPSGRSISRGITLLDHDSRDGIGNFITITGGKLTSYRLMAELCTDMVCSKLSLKRECATATTPLPGSELPKLGDIVKKHWTKATVGQKAAAGRQGTRAGSIDYSKMADRQIICECEQVTMGEIKYAVRELGVKNLADLRRRTRMSMGTCQGGFCIRKAADALAKALGTPEQADKLAHEYMNERWKGMLPVAWGDTLREMEMMQKVYKEGLKL